MKLAALSQTQSANLAAMLTGVTSSMTENKVQEASGATFSELLNSTAANTQNSSVKTGSQEDVFCVQDKATKTVSGTEVNETKSETTMQENVVSGEEDSQEAVSEEVTQAATEFVNQTVEAICDALGITQEQLNDAMETLGLSFMDLLQPQNLNELVANLTGIQDQMTLVLDENVSNLLLEVNQYAQTFMQKTNGMEIPPQVMQMMTPVAQGEEVTIDPQILTDAEASLQAPQDVLNTPQGEETVQQVTDPAEQVIAQTVTEQGTKNLTQTNEEDDASMVQNQQTTADNNTEQKESLSSDSDADDFTQSQNQQFNMNQTSAAESQNAQATTANQFAQQVQTAQTAQTVSYASNISYAQEVLDQVTEFVSTNVTADTSSIEMSLTPETLGKLYIKVAQVEGQITASITATTETARQALASQVYTLKEALNLQGIKVEAVEVSVATHEFERNLEENADSRQQEQMGEEQEKVSGGRRRSLNLSENGELPENLTEAEELAATIMKDNGNSVDLTA